MPEFEEVEFEVEGTNGIVINVNIVYDGRGYAPESEATVATNGAEGSGAIVTLITDAFGAITDVNILDGVKNYVQAMNIPEARELPAITG
ncbi:MAG: hypothetical protein AAGI07_05060 [Bacteroidota bacterium]